MEQQEEFKKRYDIKKHNGTNRILVYDTAHWLFDTNTCTSISKVGCESNSTTNSPSSKTELALLASLEEDDACYSFPGGVPPAAGAAYQIGRLINPSRDKEDFKNNTFLRSRKQISTGQRENKDSRLVYCYFDMLLSTTGVTRCRTKRILALAEHAGTIKSSDVRLIQPDLLF